MYTWDELVAMCPGEIQTILRYLDVGAATAQQLIVLFHDKDRRDTEWRWRIAESIDRFVDEQPQSARERVATRIRFVDRDAHPEEYAQRVAQALTETQGRDAYNRVMQEIALRWLL